MDDGITRNRHRAGEYWNRLCRLLLVASVPVAKPGNGNRKLHTPEPNIALHTRLGVETMTSSLGQRRLNRRPGNGM